MLDVSIIISTKNEEHNLPRLLKSISNSDAQVKQIIVVDNVNSADATFDIAQNYTTDAFKFGTERTAQRNFGLEHAHGKYVFFLDADMEVMSNTISSCYAVLEQDPTVVGVVVPEKSVGIGFWAKCKELEKSYYQGVSWMEAARFFRTKTVKELGGYNTQLVSGEDWDLSQRVERLGTIARTSSYVLHHEGTISLLKTVKKKFYYAKFFASYTQSETLSGEKKNQISVFARYKLFFSDPAKIMHNPVIWTGMLFMKTAEFLCGGLGYLYYKILK